MLAFISEYSSLITNIITILAVVVILLANKESESSIAWIVVIMVSPIVGLPLYILIGLDWRKKRLVPLRAEDIFQDKLKKILKDQKTYIKEEIEKNQEINSSLSKSLELLLNANQAVLTLDNKVDFFYQGDQMFQALFQDLKEAKESIHMEYFIWKSDKLGQKIKNILIQKAKEGVEVRLIFDGLGSFARISFKYRRELKKAGIQFSYFLDLNRFFARLKINYSNHKKIVVIDGKIAYTGGMNVGQEYIDGGRRFKSWRDTHLRVEGGSVAILQGIFLSDWFNCGYPMLIKDNFFNTESAAKGEGIPMQVTVSGPDSRWDSIELLYFNMITNAKNRIFIQSPYFIPDLAILKALEAAALSGIEVHLMMTGVPDKRVAWWAAYTYFEHLLEAGVHIHHYKKGFLHSKVMLIDDALSTVGTCNMDIRSFKLNYEVNSVFYDEKTSQKLADQFIIDLISCKEITLEDLQKIKFLPRLRNSFCKIFAPLM